MRDRRIWLTGASSGIGAALARELASRGAWLGLTARRADLLDELAVECLALGSAGAITAPADVTDAAAVAAAHEALVEGGPLDMVILSAGTWTPMPASRFSADAIERMFAVNVVGAARCVELALPTMLQRGSGHIVLVASLTSFAGLPLAAGYGATKAALRSMGDSLRADLAGTGVDVTLVHPGFVRTPMTAENRFAMPSIIEADEAARVIVRGLDRGRAEISFPRRLALPLKLLAAAPGWASRRVVARMARPAAGPHARKHPE